MTTRIAVPSPRAADRARTLLAAGAVAGPVFVGAVIVQMLTRDGFDLRRHPISLLALGDLGWIQVTNFVVAGLLGIAFAIGARDVLQGGPAATWGPRLIAVFGTGLVAGGAFLPDPGLGFPPGAPEGVPEELSLHGLLHAAAPVVAFLALILACFVVGRRFRMTGERGLAAYSAVTGIACFVLSAWPDRDGAGVRLFVGCVLGFAWLSVLAVRLDRERVGPARRQA
jgi:hypothetical membrane protein